MTTNDLKIGDKVSYTKTHHRACGDTLNDIVSGTLIGLPSKAATTAGNSDIAYLEVLTQPDEHGCADVKVQVVNIHDLIKDK